MLDETVEHRGHLAAGLATADHAQVEATEEVGVGLEGHAQGLAILDGLEHVRKQRTHGRHGGHVDQHLEGAIQGQAGAQEHGELRSHGQHVLPRRRLAPGAGRSAAWPVRAEGEERQPPGAQLARGELYTRRFERAIDGLAVATHSPVVEHRHGIRPARSGGG